MITLKKRLLMNEITDLLKGYINLKVNSCKEKLVEDLSMVSSRALAALVVTMLGAVVLQLLGIAAAFVIAELTGSFALGFFIVLLIFAVALIIVYLKRDSIFVDSMLRMYRKIIFGKEKR